MKQREPWNAMNLAKREDIRQHFPDRKPLYFDVQNLASAMERELPFVDFAFLMGSGKDGIIPSFSDLDLAVYIEAETKADFECVNRIMSVTEKALGTSIEIDVGILNSAGCVFRFKALQGHRLFVRPQKMDTYIQFYSYTCSEYEDYMYRIARYRNHRQKHMR